MLNKMMLIAALVVMGGCEAPQPYPTPAPTPDHCDGNPTLPKHC